MSDTFLPGSGFDTYESQDKVLVQMDGSRECAVAVRILQQQGFAVMGAVVRLCTDDPVVDAAKEAAKFGEVKIVASSKDKNFTYIPDVNAIDYDKDASYIHICQNNTIFGTQYVEVPQVEGVPLVADMSSMILSKPVDVTKYGCIYFGVQKNVAPAGMAIAIVRDDLLGHAADTVPTMMNYTTLLAKDSMYNTPPCWCIYMTGLVLKYLENDIGGLANMQKINEAKAKVLYDYLDGQDFFQNLSLIHISEPTRPY